MLIIEQLDIKSGGRWRDIRLAALRDAPDAFGSTLVDAETRSLKFWSKQLEQLPTFVAVLDGVDAGVARGARDTETSDTAFLLSMWVAPTARGRGLGGALISAVTNWAIAQGLSRLVLDVADINAPAIVLYKRKGFVATGETGALPVPREHITEHRMAMNLIAQAEK